MDARIVLLRGRGALTLPARLRERYALKEGDPVTLVDLDGVIVLAPRVGIVGKLAAEIERLRRGSGLSEDDLLSGLSDERRRSLEGRRGAGD